MRYYKALRSSQSWHLPVSCRSGCEDGTGAAAAGNVRGGGARLVIMFLAELDVSHCPRTL
jgi:hypothetical protein